MERKQCKRLTKLGGFSYEYDFRTSKQIEILGK